MEGLGTNLILLVCMYPFIFIMFFLLKNDGMDKKKGRFGVILNAEQQKAPEVEQITKEYGKQMNKLLLVLALIPLPILFIPWFSVSTSLWLLWLLATCFVFFIPYGIANEKLKELKRMKGWKQCGEAPVYVEMKEAGSVRRVKWFHFLPQTIISIAVFVWTVVMYPKVQIPAIPVLIGSFASVAPMFAAAAVWMDKQKTQPVSTDSDVNVNYSRAKKNLWKNFWMLCSWVNTVYTVSLLLTFDKDGRVTGGFWIGFVLYTVLTVVLCIWMLKKKAALDVAYEAKMDLAQPDDDDYWIWGMIYNNPKDKHFMVEKRVGAGTTVNVATVGGKVFVVLIGGSLLAVPLLCIYLFLLEFTPIHLTIEDNQLVASQLREEHVIGLHSIGEAELITELPKMSRNHGTSTENLRKGSYKVKDAGHCEVFLNPQNTVFIKLEAYGETYYLGGFDDEETRAIYEGLR
ncbi:MAG: hypothetical protein IJX63_03625 [Lachnospiraceae bacterium]|nr:hypothetical protein [Lachnospiraceae bacterium]